MYQLRSNPQKKPIEVESYEEAQAIRTLCMERFGRDLFITPEDQIPDEFSMELYELFRLTNALPSPFRNGRIYSVDVIILGQDLANFEEMDYSALLAPYIADNNKLVEQFKSGNDKALNALMGKFLKDHKGHDAKAVKDALTQILSI